MVTTERLTEEILKLEQSPENEARIEKWRSFLRTGKGIPIVVFAEESFWAAALGYDLPTYYRDPELLLRVQLMTKLYAFRKFQDWSILSRDISLYFGTGFVQTLFGQRAVVGEMRPLSVDASKPLVTKERDLGLLKCPDFYRSGLMPRAHKFYRKITKMTKGRLNVIFPQWLSGPWAVAWHLRGMLELMKDTIRNPALVHKLMRFAVNARVQWEEERIRFAGDIGASAFSTPLLPSRSPRSEGTLGSDEVSCAFISPRAYDEFIFPYEKELASRYDRVYYHSCGQLTPILHKIRELPNLYKIEICRTGKTDLETAKRELPRDIILQLAMEPLGDVLLASRSKVEKVLQDLQAKSDGSPIEIWLEGINYFSPLGVNGIEKKIRSWLTVANKVLRS